MELPALRLLDVTNLDGDAPGASGHLENRTRKGFQKRRIEREVIGYLFFFEGAPRVTRVEFLNLPFVDIDPSFRDGLKNILWIRTDTEFDQITEDDGQQSRNDWNSETRPCLHEWLVLRPGRMMNRSQNVRFGVVKRDVPSPGILVSVVLAGVIRTTSSLSTERTAHSLVSNPILPRSGPLDQVVVAP